MIFRQVPLVLRPLGGVPKKDDAVAVKNDRVMSIAWNRWV